MERDIQSKNIEVLDENLKNIVISRMRRHYYYSPVSSLMSKAFAYLFFFSPFSQCRSWMESSFYLGLLWPLFFFVFLIFTSKQNEGNKNKSCLHGLEQWGTENSPFPDNCLFLNTFIRILLEHDSSFYSVNLVYF